MIVSFSGIDGSGKTTYSSKLCELLIKNGYKAKLGIPKYSCNSIVKEYCKFRFNDEHAYFPLLDSKFYLSTIALDWIDWWQSEYKLNEDTIYCCDRYLIDTYTQAIQYHCELNFLKQLFEVLPMPDFSFFLKIDPKVADERLKIRTYPPRHSLETYEEIQRLNNSFQVAKDNTEWDFLYVESEDDMQKNLDNILKLVIKGYEDKYINK